MLTKSNASAAVAEFVGTFILALAVLTVSKSTLNLAFFISVSAGLVVVAMTLVFGRISGAQLNPAITLGLLSIKRISALKALIYIIAQLIGGITAYFLFTYFSGQKWHNTGHFETKLLIAEFLGAILFSLGWASVVFRKIESAKAASTVGLSLTLALLVMSSAGVVTLNPAVALGIRSWVWGSSVLGPIVGAVIGFQVYQYLFVDEVQSPKPSTDEEKTTKIMSGRPQLSKKLR